MAEEFGVQPEGFRAASDHVGGLSAPVHEVAAGVARSGEGAPWGGCALGQEFASGFVPMLDMMHGELRALAGHLENLGHNGNQSAVCFENADNS